ncbi:MAG TPA: histidine phosphatase family protein [Acidimicrobiales bacterium]|nr:histidine phosphatase family protein [Acidimicrobiales bacterium]
MSGWSELPPGLRTRGDPSTATRVVLIRHGDSMVNALGIVGGIRSCTGLTDLGRAQADALADRLVKSRELMGASAVYTSVLPRAIETAQRLSRGLPDVELVADCDLCELHPGDADGLTWAQYLERYGAPDWGSHPDAPFSPNGESWSGFFFRCRDAFARLAERHRGEQVVVVAHGGVVEQAMKIYRGSEPGERLMLLTENCSMTELELDGLRRLLRYNDLAPETGA